MRRTFPVLHHVSFQTHPVELIPAITQNTFTITRPSMFNGSLTTWASLYQWHIIPSALLQSIAENHIIRIFTSWVTTTIRPTLKPFLNFRLRAEKKITKALGNCDRKMDSGFFLVNRTYRQSFFCLLCA